jgi:hypothetical protein
MLGADIGTDAGATPTAATQGQGGVQVEVVQVTNGTAGQTTSTWSRHLVSCDALKTACLGGHGKVRVLQ